MDTEENYLSREKSTPPPVLDLPGSVITVSLGASAALRLDFARYQA